MSNPIEFTPAECARQGLEENLVRYLTFLGITPDEWVELTALGPGTGGHKTTYTALGRGIPAAVRLAQEGGLLTAGRNGSPLDGIYVLCNKPVPAVGSKHEPNKWHHGIERVKDGEIARRRVVYLDLDPKRLSGTSSTDAEHRAAFAALDAVIATLSPYVKGRGCVGYGSSGNGYHVQIAIDCPNTDEVKNTIERFLAIMDVMHSGDHYGHQVDVDRSVGNAARLSPAFGTLKCKGVDTETDPELRRPHRRSWFWCRPNPQRLSETELSELVQKLEAALTIEQHAVLAKGTPMVTLQSADPDRYREGPLAVAKRHPIREVAQWLGLYDGTELKCPGCARESKQGGMVSILEKANRLKCSSGTCAKGGRKGNRSTVDLVLEVKNYPKTKEGLLQAAKEICENFNLDFKKGRGRQTKVYSDEQLAEMSGFELDVYEPKPIDRVEPREPTLEIQERPRRYNLTDLGNAERLVARHGHDLRYVTGWQRWLVWDGRRWSNDPNGLLVSGLANETVRSIYGEAAEEPDQDQKQELVRWAKTSEMASRLGAMVSLASTLRSVHVDHEGLDLDRYLLNCPNGTVDLRSGLLREHRREDLITKITKVNYKPDADSSLFASCLAKSQPNPEMREYLLRAWGYSLTADVGEHVFLVHYGPKGRNGKGTLINSIAEVLGDYGEPAIPRGVLMDQGNEHPTGLTTLHGRRFCVASETGKGKKLKIDLVKSLTGGDRITAHRMREDFWTFVPTHKLHLLTNHKPSVPESPDDPIWERIHLVPWTVHLAPGERIKNLDQQLQGSGAEGLLAELVRGCLEWQRLGLQPPRAVLEAGDQYRDESDALAQFVDEHIEFEEGAEVTVSSLYARYREWAEADGQGHPLTKILLGKILNDREVGRPGKSSKTGQAIREGIRLRPTPQQAAEDRTQVGAAEELRRFGETPDFGFTDEDV